MGRMADIKICFNTEHMLPTHHRTGLDTGARWFVEADGGRPLVQSAQFISSVARVSWSA